MEETLANTTNVPRRRLAGRIALGCLLVIGLAGGALFYQIGSLLSVIDPVHKADLVLCLTGGSERFDKTAELLRQSMAGQAVMTTEGAYRQMMRRQITPDKLIKPRRPANSTYEEAQQLKEVLAGRSGSVLVVSDRYHLYRARWTLRHLFKGRGDVSFTFIASDAPSLQGFWWSTAESRLFVLSELPKIVYYWVWHGWFDRAEDPAWALRLERQYLALLRFFFAAPAKKAVSHPG